MGRHKKEVAQVVELAEKLPVEVVAEDIPDKGIFCPECKYIMRVCYTRPLGDRVRRVRICDRCGHRRPTEEK